MSTTSKYWGGSGITSAAIRPLEAETFKDIIERQINTPVGIPMLREVFFAKTADERNQIKAGPFITACSFKNGTMERRDINAEAMVLPMLDIDNGEDARRFAEAPDTLSELLWPYSFACYLTASSTPENPRMRVMVDALPYAPEHHKRVIAFITHRLGLPSDFKGKRESGVVSQPQFRPVAFLGESHSPVICSRTDGQALDIDDVPEEIPAEDGEERCYTFTGDFGDDMGLAYLPVQNLTVEDIRGPLNSLSADMSYEPWTHVIACLRHQFREPEEAKEAFDALVEWSATSDKFKDNECYRKWRSFTPSPKGKVPRTIRTLFKMAIAAGWNSAPLAEKVQQDVEAWINACGDIKTLISEGCQRINAMPFRNAVMEDYLVGVMQKKAKGFSGVTVDKAAIRKELSNVKYLKRVEEQGVEKPTWLSPFVYVGKQNVFCNKVTGEPLIPESFDNMFSLNLVSKDSESESAKSGRPAVLPRHYALNQIQIERVYDTMYCPLLGSEAEPLITYKGQLYLNTYRPSTAPVMDAARSKEAGRLFKEHMAILVEDAKDRRHVIDFMCHNVQFPGVKIPWAIFIQSAEGVGKGFLGRMMAGVLGRPNVKTIGPQVLISQWNDWQIGAIFAILEELHIPGHQREAVMNSLKVAVSDPIVSINRRNTHTFDAPNYTNFIGFSNFEDAIHLKPTDRRWDCIKSTVQTEEQVMELNATGHFTRMEPLLEELSGALRHWMMNHKISDTFPRHGPAPKTKYRQALIENSKNPMLVAIENLIRDPGEPLIGDDVVHLSHLEIMTGYLSKTSAKVSSYLRQLGYERWNNGEMRGGTEFFIHPARYIPELGDPDELLALRTVEGEL